ncbi:hypothetical protein C8Q74DRAFT_1362633 [Fomes fomentarius]|nr:hypothetical protein C8Q74DRAFT_1362633 [Fomes fomentarius]
MSMPTKPNSGNLTLGRELEHQSSEVGLAQKLDGSPYEAATPVSSTDQELAKIRQRLAFLTHDLRTFSANADAAERLNTSVHAHFLGPPYLSPNDAGLFLEKGMDALVAARKAKSEWRQ